MLHVAITDEEKPPHRMVELYGGFVLSNRLVVTDCPGQVDLSCHLLDKLVVNIASDYAGDYANGKRRKNTTHNYHLLPSWINAVIGSGGICEIIPDKFQTFKLINTEVCFALTKF